MPRRAQRPLWITLLGWAALCTLMGWGLYQTIEFRRQLLAQADLPADNLPPSPPETTQPALALDAAHIDALETPKAPPEIDLPDMPRTRDPMPDPPHFDESLSADVLVSQAQVFADEGRMVEAREALNFALARTADAALAASLRARLNALNVPVFFGTEIWPADPYARLVDIQPGDSFLRLGHDFALTTAYLQAINPALSPRNLKPGSPVKIAEGPFDIRVTKAARRLDLYLGPMYIASCPVEFPEGNTLPLGVYRIAPNSKTQNGSATAGHAWLGFEGIDPGTMAVTRGWIYDTASTPRNAVGQNFEAGLRLAESDVLQLYNTLVETRSQLRVEP